MSRDCHFEDYGRDVADAPRSCCTDTLVRLCTCTCACAQWVRHLMVVLVVSRYLCLCLCLSRSLPPSRLCALCVCPLSDASYAHPTTHVRAHTHTHTLPCVSSCECHNGGNITSRACAYTGNVAPNARLNIPPINMNDGPQGFRESIIPGTTTAWFVMDGRKHTSSGATLNILLGEIVGMDCAVCLQVLTCTVAFADVDVVCANRPSGLTVAASWDVDAMLAWGDGMYLLVFFAETDPDTHTDCLSGSSLLRHRFVGAAETIYTTAPHITPPSPQPSPLPPPPPPPPPPPHKRYGKGIFCQRSQRPAGSGCVLGTCTTERAELRVFIRGGSVLGLHAGATSD